MLGNRRIHRRRPAVSKPEEVCHQTRRNANRTRKPLYLAALRTQNADLERVESSMVGNRPNGSLLNLRIGDDAGVEA